MSEVTLEILVDGTPDAAAAADNEADIEVLVGSVFSSGTVELPEVVEIYTETPEQITEPWAFTHTGVLTPKTGMSYLPIAGGIFAFSSIAAKVVIAPQGGSVVIDILKNGVSIFSNPSNRPTILDQTTDAVVGSWGSTTLEDGDSLSVDIVTVGAVVMGSHLSVAIRLTKVSE